MATDKPEEVVEEVQEEMEEGLDDFNPEELVEPTPEEINAAEIEKLKSAYKKIISAVKTNQKYIKRNFERIGEIEDNFKISLKK